MPKPASPPVSVASGIPYPVVAVNGRGDVHVAELEGDATITVSLPDVGAQDLEGCVSRVDGTVRFHEKGRTATGKDVRLWTLAEEGDGVTATAQARF